MNTAAICSLFTLSCIQKTSKPRLDTVKIGVQSDLLSFDPFSFQSLGEKNITDLLYDRLVYFDGENLKSDLSVTLRLKSKSLLIEGLSPKERKKIKDIFEKARSSVLWKSVFEPFEFIKKSGEVWAVVYSNKANFVSNLKSLAPLLVLEGGKHGAYKIESLKKGVSLSLIENKKWTIELSRTPRIVLRKVKTVSEGLKQLSVGEIDVFVPFEPLKKNVLKPFGDLVVAVNSADQVQKLRLYSKFSKLSFLNRIFCTQQSEIAKVLETSWKLTDSGCSSLAVTKARDLKLILSSDYGLQIVDILARSYFEETGKKLDYEVLSGMELSQKLKAGDFNHYLSLDVESSSLPVPYDSFHSKGRYNSFEFADKKLDTLLDKSSEALSLKGFLSLEQKSRTRLKEVQPVVFEYSRPQTEYFIKKNSPLKTFKSSKTLMNFKK